MTLAAYAEGFERFAAGLSPARRAARREQLGRFLESGFPTRRLEAWHYTDLSALGTQRFSPVNDSGTAPALDWIAGTDRLLYRNGWLDRAQSTLPDLHADDPDTVATDDGVTALNAAFSSGGLHLRLGRNQRLPRPLHVVALGDTAAASPGMTHQRHRIELAENAEATVIFQFLGHSASRLTTQVIDIGLAAGAKLSLYRLQNEHDGATLLTRIDTRLGRDSRLQAVAIDGGGGLVRHDFNVLLAEAGAEVDLSGLYRPAPDAHIDNQTRIVHAAPHCRSRERFKGIVDARARAIFVGKVIVQPGAQKTDSEQHVANLLLSRKAEVNAKPELEIYADDVKCAHGATVGQLDDNALEYLRSRGIAGAEARALLLRAFGAAILNRIAIPALRRGLALHLSLADEEDFEEPVAESEA